LGIVQGATEFAPISSSGHLVLVPWLLRWPQPELVFDTTLHLGTLAAVLAFFWRDCLKLLVAWWESGRRRRLHSSEARIAWGILVGTIPAALLGYLFEDFFAAFFGSPLWVAVFLLITGMILALSERLGRREHGLEAMTWTRALCIGLAQVMAILPGISRSGVTIGAGLALGFKRDAAARFSFLLSIPIILGSGIFKLLDFLKAENASLSASNLLVGFTAAAISGYLCIKLLLSFLQRGRLYAFVVYCWAAGLSILLLLLLRGG